MNNERDVRSVFLENCGYFGTVADVNVVMVVALAQLIFELLWRDKDMAIVLNELPHSEKSGECTGEFVPMENTEVCSQCDSERPRNELRLVEVPGLVQMADDDDEVPDTATAWMCTDRAACARRRTYPDLR